MTNVTVKQFAEENKIPVDRLMTQLTDAGIKIADPEHIITSQEKQKWLDHLKQPKKISLKRKTQSTLKVTGAQGKAKTVQIEVRKKRTFVKRTAEEEKAAKVDEDRAKEEEARKERKAAESAAEEKRKAAEATAVEKRQAKQEQAVSKEEQEKSDQIEEERIRQAAEEREKEKAKEQTAKKQKAKAAKSGKREKVQLHLSINKF